MLEFERSTVVPHLYVRCGGDIVFEDLVERAPALERLIERLGRGVVVACDTTALRSVDAEAVGVLCYLVQFTLRTRPRAVLAVVPAEGALVDEAALAVVCTFARRADLDGCLRVLERPEALEEALAALRGG